MSTAAQTVLRDADRGATSAAQSFKNEPPFLKSGLLTCLKSGTAFWTEESYHRFIGDC